MHFNHLMVHLSINTVNKSNQNSSSFVLHRGKKKSVQVVSK